MSTTDLTEIQIRLVEASFAAVAPKGGALAASFYERLFCDYPEVKPMFSDVGQHERQKRLLGSLVLVVNNLRKPAALSPALEQLGSCMYELGTEPAHYEAAGCILLKTLAKYASNIWDIETEEAWSTVNVAVSTRMQESAQVSV